MFKVVFFFLFFVFVYGVCFFLYVNIALALLKSMMDKNGRDIILLTTFFLLYTFPQTDPVPCEQECIQGCSCPPGMTRSQPGKEGKCIWMEDCNCKHEDKFYKKGETAVIKERTW